MPDQELQKVKNNFAAQEYRKLSSNYPILMQLLYYDGLGNWREINEAGRKFQAVTAAELKRVVNTYFTKENRAVGIYTRKKGTAAPPDPELAGLNAEQKAMLEAALSKLKIETDVEKLKAARQRIESQSGQAPAEVKAVLAIYSRKIQERIAPM